MPRTFTCFAIACLACLVFAGPMAQPVRGEDWPQFRGPNCGGVSLGEKPLPVHFSTTENLAWSAEVGDGVSSPVVAAGRAFTTAMRDETFVVYAFDAATGKKLWQRELATGPEPLPKITAPNSHAASTPAADAERVYVYFSTLGLLAFDAATGEPAWHCKLPVPYLVFDWGPAASPVLHGDAVLFCQDDDLQPAIYSIDKASGEIRWKTERNEMLASYSCPVICQADDRDEIVVAGTGKLIGYDPADGHELWHARVLLRNIKTSPVSQAGVVYVSLESAGIAQQWIAANDADKDGKLSREEVPQPLWKKFDRGDANRDGFLENEELDLAFLDPDNQAGTKWDAEEQQERFVLAVRGGGRGDVTGSHVVWRHASRSPDSISSPLVLDGRIFLVKSGGLSSCFDTAAGEPLWSLKRIDNNATYYASPVAGDGKIYCAGENGLVAVLKQAEDVEVLAVNDLGESILGTPAIADGRLFFRTRHKLMCVHQEMPREE
ncbi:MAG: PQQ-binding-like beta-propeller repeat protein [Pirellulales bacterium]